MVVLLMMTFSVTSYSQVTVESLETLPDGTIIVVSGGVSYRGLPAPKLREILKDKAELDTLRTSYSTLQAQVVEIKRISDELKVTGDRIFVLETTKRDKQITFWKGQYEAELRLRTKFQKELESCSKFIIWRIC